MHAGGFVFWENVIARFGALALVAYGVHLYRTSLVTHRKRLVLLEHFVCCCPGCGRMPAAREGWFFADELFTGDKQVRYCPACARQAEK